MAFSRRLRRIFGNRVLDIAGSRAPRRRFLFSLCRGAARFGYGFPAAAMQSIAGRFLYSPTSITVAIALSPAAQPLNSP